MSDAVGPVDLPGVRLGVVRGISYGLFGEPDEFLPQARALGAGLIRAYVYWGQVEPEPGRYVWDAVDALLKQCDGDEEIWLTVCSSSPWATRQPTDFLPPSPAHDLTVYCGFVRRLVQHCAGRVRYWQCDNEPSNTGLLWAGTAAEYVAQLQTMHSAVTDADPAAVVVLGGCGYDVFSGEEGSAPRQFFDHLTSAGRDGFDVFSVNLYGDPADVPRQLAMAEAMMRAHGYTRPIVVGEYGGPVLFEFPELEPIVAETFAAAFSGAPGGQSTDELTQQAGQDTPERRAMAALYDRMSDLPPRLQMFMAGCPPELEAKRHRISCRQIVMRTLLALSAGVRRTVCWDLAPEVPAATDPYQLMHLMFGKLPLLDYEGRSLSHRHPSADTFALLTGQLAGGQTVTRLDLDDDHPATLYAFRVDRADRPPLLVFWDHRDPFDGEDEPPITVSWPWQAPGATTIDALGHTHPTEISDGHLRLDVSLTPIFVTVHSSG